MTDRSSSSPSSLSLRRFRPDVKLGIPPFCLAAFSPIALHQWENTLFNSHKKLFLPKKHFPMSQTSIDTLTHSKKCLDDITSLLVSAGYPKAGDMGQSGEEFDKVGFRRSSFFLCVLGLVSTIGGEWGWYVARVMSGDAICTANTRIIGCWGPCLGHHVHALDPTSHFSAHSSSSLVDFYEDLAV